MRRLTAYESERVEQLLENWVQSKCGARIGDYAMSSAYEDQVEGRSAEFVTRYPVIQVDADRVDAVVYGRKATQFLAARAPMRSEWQLPLIMEYLQQCSRAAIARRMEIAPRTVADRVAAAKWTIWDTLTNMCDSAETRASQ